MSVPTTFEFAVVSYRALGSSGPYTKLCGIQTTGFNRTVNSNDRFLRDCEDPAAVPARSVRVSGKQWDLTGTGLANLDQLELIDPMVGKRLDYKYTIMDIDGEEPEEVGSWTGVGVMTSANMGTTEGNDATLEIAIASTGLWAYVVATPPAEG